MEQKPPPGTTSMPAYFILALIMSCTWLVLFIFRKDMRTKMLIMSFAVIPFAFFDYYSQPGYWHPETFLSIPVGIEGVLFGFSFGGVAAAVFSPKTIEQKEMSKAGFDIRNFVALSPVLIISIGAWQLFDVNMMISLPIGLLAGILLILKLRRDLAKTLLCSGISFGILYSLVLSLWLLIFPQAQGWWDLGVYGGFTIVNVPLGEVLFGFLFGGFWGALYAFIMRDKQAINAVSTPLLQRN